MDELRSQHEEERTFLELTTDEDKKNLGKLHEKVLHLVTIHHKKAHFMLLEQHLNESKMIKAKISECEDGMAKTFEKVIKSMPNTAKETTESDELNKSIQRLNASIGLYAQYEKDLRAEITGINGNERVTKSLED